MAEATKERGPVTAWLAAVGGLGMAGLYAAMMAAEGGVGDGEGGTFALVGVALVQTVTGGGTRRYPASIGPDRR